MRVHRVSLCGLGLALLPAGWFLMCGAGAVQIYTDVTTQMGIYIPGLGSGTAWSDFDNDGDLDLLASDSSYPYHVFLYRNDGTVFTDVTGPSTISGQSRNFAVGDFDNDGFEDVAIISLGYVATRLFRNLGGMIFEDISTTAGISGTYMRRCAWIDYDRDGYLDLYTVGTGSHLFHSRGEGTFEDVTSLAGISGGGNTCAWLDYDSDGFPDCYVGGGSANRLYRNRGDGTFEEVGAAAGVNDPYSTSGVCAGDFDGDGHFDLYTVNIGSPSNRLYRNRGDGTFEEVTSTAGVGDVGDGRTATFLDIDFDGLVDLFSSNHVYPNRLYRNNGDGTFTDIAPGLNIASPSDPFGTGFGDFDNDGDLDAFLTTHWGNRLLRCDGMTNHWIHVRLRGTVANRSAIGGIVRCTSGGHTSWMHVDGGHGMGDTDSPALEFGLGAAAQAAEIEVLWPSGRVETWCDLSPDTWFELVEGDAAAVVVAPRESKRLALLSVSPNPSADLCTLRFHIAGQGVEPVQIALFDLGGRLLRRRRILAQEEVTTVVVRVDDLPAGSCFLRLTSRNGIASTRILALGQR
ncbi:CRTAC1 family protein [Candidatus Bipolaricaulota bacterium]|nr:CRTAC1 family protein [Candidatus Bipolaricaulota bacterium]